MEFEQVEPFGYLPDERRFARLQAQIHNKMRGKDDIALMELDFCPDHPKLDKAKERRVKDLTEPKQTAAQMKAMLFEIAGKSLVKKEIKKETG